MGKQTEFLGIPDSFWGVIGLLALLALVALAFVLDLGVRTL